MLSTKTKILAEKTFSGTCPHCGNTGTVKLFVSQNYTCFLGISYWPLKKLTFSQCSHCKQALSENEMPSMMRSEVLPMLKSAKTPLLSYGGLIFIFACFGYGLYSAYSQDVRADKLVHDPKVGDLYYVNFKIDEYAAMKITRVTRDSVFFNQTRYIADQEDGISKILKKEPPFEDVEIGFSKSELLEDAKTNKILDIKR